MKYIAIVDLPDDADEWGDGKWIITGEGEIRYRKDDNVWCLYSDIKDYGIELKPLPEMQQKDNSNDINFGYELGWDACLDEILGETE